MIKGVIIKAVGGVFTVQSDEGKFVCYSPKKFRYNSEDVCVGDYVTFSKLKYGKGVVEEVLPRKNRLNRPIVANVDAVFAVIAPVPQPDLLLLDKIIVNCYANGIEPIVVLNKCDLTQDADDVLDSYSNVCATVKVSANTGFGVDKLSAFVQNKTVCFAGQSAVGKTSLLNRILPEVSGKTGDLSQKTQRGMHTTRHCQLYPAFGGFIADTPGFSLLDLSVPSRELPLYYDDMLVLSANCRYKSSCAHLSEPDCAVKSAVENGTFPRGRYERYRTIFAELSEQEKEKYQ